MIDDKVMMLDRFCDSQDDIKKNIVEAKVAQARIPRCP